MDARLPPSTATQDARDVRRARRGELDAFDALIGRYQRQCVSVAYRLLGDIQDALEVCQEAFIRAFTALDKLDDPSRFRPWLMKIITNQSLNYRRGRAAGGRRVSLDDCFAGAESGEGAASNGQRRAGERPDEPLAAAELKEAVHRAIGRLTEQQRVALVLFSIEQVPQKDVAEIMGCSVEAVKWHVFQARKRLREWLSELI